MAGYRPHLLWHRGSPDRPGQALDGRRPHLRPLRLRSLVCLRWVCHRGRCHEDQVGGILNPIQILLFFRCMVVTTLVLSIISAILAGILTLIQIVALFGLPRHHCYPCPISNATQPVINSTQLPMLRPEEEFHHGEECCTGPDDQDSEESHWGPDTLIYLFLGLLMLAISIYSATIACLVKEERNPGMVWTQGKATLPSDHDHNHQEVGSIQHKVKDLLGPRQDQHGTSHQVAVQLSHQKIPIRLQLASKVRGLHGRRHRTMPPPTIRRGNYEARDEIFNRTKCEIDLHTREGRRKRANNVKWSTN